jgi:hypothetical protein
MKELVVKKIKPIHNIIILTADKFTQEEMLAASNGLFIPNKEGQLKPYQTIVEVSESIAHRGLEKGMLVSITFENYRESLTHVKDSLRQSVDEFYNPEFVYNIPIVEIGGVPHLKLRDIDIEYIIDDYEYKEIETSNLITETKKDIIIPNKNIVL